MGLALKVVINSAIVALFIALVGVILVATIVAGLIVIAPKYVPIPLVIAGAATVLLTVHSRRGRDD